MRHAQPRLPFALLALALLVGACAKDKTTGLDIKLTVTGTGTIDQVRIDAVTLGGTPVALDGEQTLLFPAQPRMLKTGDVLTVWFADSADAKMVVVTATGRRCGQDATAQTMTAPKALAKGQTVETTLSLDATLAVTCSTDGGAGKGGAGGSGGAGGTGGIGGTGGAAGSGVGGATAGVAGSSGAGGAGGVAGSAAGAAGRGGAGGSAGGGGVTAGAAGSSGRGGAGGTAGAAGRGGAGGTAGSAGRGGAGGTAGSAGRGGAGGTGGAAGRGGSAGGGATGTGGGCATTPGNAKAQAAGVSQTTTCGYPLQTSGVQYLLTGPDYYALANPVAFLNGANCGRCVDLVYSAGGAQPTHVTVTVVGLCDAAQCPDQNNAPSFGVGVTAFQVLTPNVQSQLPPSGTTLTYSFVPCPVPPNTPPILGNVRTNNGAPAAILFVQQRYGIASGSVTDTTTNVTSQLARGNDNYWSTPNGVLGGSTVTFQLLDVNDGLITIPNFSVLNPPAFNSTGKQFPLCPLTP